MIDAVYKRSVDIFGDTGEQSSPPRYNTLGSEIDKVFEPPPD